jgi:hypothetical protein
MAGPEGDAITPPPALEAVLSPGGGYLVEIRWSAQAGPHAAGSTATLLQLSGGARRVVWQQALPHRPRPRFVRVSDAGQLVLFDDWLNVRSERAVVVLGPAGQTVAQHDLEAVRAALGVPAAALAPLARHGVWMQTVPRLTAQGDACEVQAGGRTLRVNLPGGELAVR